MPLASSLTTHDEEFRLNREHFLALRDLWRKQCDAASAHPDDPAVVRHKKRGKLLARERVESLLDSGAPFLEVAALAGANLYEGVRPGAGIVCGIGRVCGREVMIVANDATVKGGTYFPMTVKKHLRAQEIALENHLPCVYLVDSGGAFLPMQDQVFPDRDHFGRIFYNQARMSALRIPQLAVVMGSCTAGGAYVPAMSDETIIVREQGTIFLGGPPLVKAATNEEISAEELGGGDVHTRISGVADHLAADDFSALQMCRRLVQNLGVRPSTPLDIQTSREPLLDPEEIYGLLPRDSRKLFPMREILARIVDESELDEFKHNYGKSVICGFARVRGILCGVVANDGILFSESALKAAHFIELCEQRRIPLVFFQNIVGFMVGREYEHRGIAKDGAKMVTAVACARVPKVTLFLGGSFGAGNYAMAGRAYQPRFLFTWPNSRISVMGPEQAASVLTQIKRDGLQARGEQWEEAAATAYRQEIEATYNKQAHALYATAQLWDDGIIDPLATRDVIALTLDVTSNGPWDGAGFGVFRM